MDLEGLKAIFEDKNQHIAVASVVKVSLASDKSHLKCLVNVFPEEREMVARMTWESAGPEAGIFQFPVPNDMVLIAFADKDPNQCFVIKRLTSKEDKIPMQAVSGDTAIVSLSGKKVWLTSNTRINISKSATEPTQNLVLGQVFKTLMSTFMEKYIAHKHIGNLGYYTTPPDNAADVTTLKADPVDNGAVLSDIAFTEK